MDRKRPNENPCNPNAGDGKLKSGGEIDQTEGAAALVQLQTADIFKLDIDCFEEAFDYLQLADLMNVGLTCKRLNQVVGSIINQNYSARKIPITDKYIYPKFKISRESQAKYFCRYLKRTAYEDETMNYLPKFNALKRFQLFTFLNRNLAEFKLERHREKLKKVEHLDVYDGASEGNFHDDVLAFFPNIKRLCIPTEFKFESRELIIGNSIDWLQRIYPSLEHFECNRHNLKIEDLLAFLQLNPNIRNVSVNAKLFKGNELSLINSNIKLNDLAILFARPYSDLEHINIEASFYQLLNRLFERGFYKRLKLYFHGGTMNQNSIDQLKSLNALGKLSIQCRTENPVALSSLISLEELCVDWRDGITDWTDLPTKLTKLERLQINVSSTADILPFISRARNLEKIRIIDLGGGYRINLTALNKEREKLFGACKTTIYLLEKDYLPTKWAQKETDFSLIRLKRTESFERNEDFNITFYALLD